MTDKDLILAIVEPDINPQAVFERAAWLARIHDCRLTLLLCDPDIGPLRAGWYVSNEARDIGESIVAAQKEMIEELADNVRDTDIDVSTGILEERPVADAIVFEVNERQPKLLVKGTHYHSAAQRAIFVDTDWQLVRSCPCPLYLVKPTEIEENPVIVAAVDPTHAHDKPAALDKAIVSAALDLAGRVGGDVHLLHTYQRLVGVGSAATRTFKPVKLPLDELDEKIRTEHRERLDELAAEFDIDKDHVHQLPGQPRELLPTFARTHNAGVFVMGGLARWSLKRAVIGSTAERVLDHLPCDVIIVRPPEDDG
jgi:universal stress protein E